MPHHRLQSHGHSRRHTYFEPEKEPDILLPYTCRYESDGVQYQNEEKRRLQASRDAHRQFQCTPCTWKGAPDLDLRIQCISFQATKAAAFHIQSTISLFRSSVQDRSRDTEEDKESQKTGTWIETTWQTTGPHKIPPALADHHGLFTAFRQNH